MSSRFRTTKLDDTSTTDDGGSTSGCIRSRATRLVLEAYRFAFVIGLGAAGSSCSGGETDEQGTTERIRAVCEDLAGCDESAFSVDECVDQMKQYERSARQNNCGDRFEPLLACIEQNPIDCQSGPGVSSDACRAEGDSLSACLLQDPFAVCDLSDDPCTTCVCQACPCDADCQREGRELSECSLGCPELDADCQQACLDGVGPSYQQFLDCRAMDVCSDECAADLEGPGGLGAASDAG